MKLVPSKGSYIRKMRTKIENVTTLTFCMLHVVFTVQISYVRPGVRPFRLPVKRILKLPDAQLNVPLKSSSLSLRRPIKAEFI